MFSNGFSARKGRAVDRRLGYNEVTNTNRRAAQGRREEAAKAEKTSDEDEAKVSSSRG